MTAVLTSAGATHLAQLAQGSITTNGFDALVFGQGNDDPATSDTLANVTQRLDTVARVAAGFPKQGDTDARNSGAGATTWTWRFELPAGTGFVASNCAITNFSGGAFVSNAPLAVHAKGALRQGGTLPQAIAQRQDERFIVWVNARVGEEPMVITALEQSLESRVQRVSGFAARNRALSGFPSGITRSDSEVTIRPQPGQLAFSFADVWGVEGLALATNQVERFTVTRERWKASEARYVPEEIDLPIECGGRVFDAPIEADSRSPHAYNVRHGYRLPRGVDEKTYRLRYKLELCDGDVRGWTAYVEVQE